MYIGENPIVKIFLQRGKPASSFSTAIVFFLFLCIQFSIAVGIHIEVLNYTPRNWTYQYHP